MEILERHEHGQPEVEPVLTTDEIVSLQQQVSQVDVSRPVREYIASIVGERRES